MGVLVSWRSGQAVRMVHFSAIRGVRDHSSLARLMFLQPSAKLAFGEVPHNSTQTNLGL